MSSEVPAPAQPEGLGDAARRAVAAAEAEARDLGHERIGTEHLLLGLLSDPGSRAAAVLGDAGVTLAAARDKVNEAVGASAAAPPPATEALPMTARAGRAVNRAARLARQRRADRVAAAHLLWGVLDVEGRAGQVLRTLGVDIEGLRAALADLGQPTVPQPAPHQAAVPHQPDAPPRVAPQPAAPQRAAPPRAVPHQPAPGGHRPPHDRPVPPVDPAPSRAQDRRAPPPTCPSCGAALDDALVVRVVAARGGRGTRDAFVFSCGACGRAIGAAPA